MPGIVPVHDAAARVANKEKIIVALDVNSAGTARVIVKELAGEVGAFKIGLRLFTAAGASFVQELTEGGTKVFLDLKFHDIPNTVGDAAAEAAKMGVWMFNVHALGGAAMMRRTVEAVKEHSEKRSFSRPKIIAVTILTSSDANNLREVGIVNDIEGQVLNLARLAADCGLDGVVASPLETESLRRVCSDDFLIVTPGIRPKFATQNDQRRVMTPGGAIAAGSSYVVIGRPILQQENRLEAVRRICDEIETANK